MENVIQFLKHKKILEPNYLNVHSVQIEFPVVIVFDRLIGPMNFAVQFDRKAFGVTIKIKNIIADTVLPAKLASDEIGVFQRRPEKGFRRR